MRRAMVAVVALMLTAGCTKSGEDRNGQADAAPTAQSFGEATKPFAWAKTFTGTYTSTWGDTVFTQNEAAVNATYPGGSLTCTARQQILDCTWREGEAFGKAQLKRGMDGVIEGTWGNGEDYAGAGEWTFTPKK